VVTAAVAVALLRRRGRPEDDEISHFFNVYKDLEPGKHSDISGWPGRDQAESTLTAARRR
jgi:inorganic pyrophosphatase